jgi:MFS family permease
MMCVSTIALSYVELTLFRNGLNILPSYTNYFDLNAYTLGLSTAAVYIGGCLAGPLFGPLTDILGRRSALLWAAVLTLCAVVLQAAAQNIAMFVVARIGVGLGTAASGLTGPAYLAETLPNNRRAWGLGVFNDFYYVGEATRATVSRACPNVFPGGLIAAGITLGTSSLNSTWAWRIPSALQGLFSLICILIIPFLPESPRWLWHKGFHARARATLAATHRVQADADATLAEIAEALARERAAGQRPSVAETLRTPGARKRVLLACSAAVFSTIAGNVIASYYLGAASRPCRSGRPLIHAQARCSRTRA